jgi:hypothetical protein
LSPAILPDDLGDPGTPRSAASEFPRPATAPTCKSVQPGTGAEAKEIEASEVSPTLANWDWDEEVDLIGVAKVVFLPANA